MAANTARDLGGRLAGLTIYGKGGQLGFCTLYRVFSDCRSLAAGGKYAAIAALTSIPASLFGVLLYEIFLVDSARGRSLQYVLRLSSD